jgi:hypothetical protein
VDSAAAIYARLSAADRLRLLALDAELRHVPRPLIDAIWAGVDALEGSRVSQGGPRQSRPGPSLESETP